MAEQSAAQRDTAPQVNPPIEETDRADTAQPDPLPQTATSHIGPGGLTLLGVVIILILSVVLYGLNGPSPGNSTLTSAAPNAPPPAAPTGGKSAAPTPNAPQSGSHSPG
jgi:hypothetical protein